MKERLEIINDRYNYLCEELLKPEVYNDYKKMQEVSKEKNSIEKTVETYKRYNTVLDDIEAAKDAVDLINAIGDLTIAGDSVGMPGTSSGHVCNVCYLNGHYY